MISTSTYLVPLLRIMNQLHLLSGCRSTFESISVTVSPGSEKPLQLSMRMFSPTACPVGPGRVHFVFRLMFEYGSFCPDSE